MNWKLVLEKSLICLLLLFFLFIGWVFARFIILLMVGQRFYLRFADAAACTLAVFIVLWVFAFVRAKVTNLLFVTCLIAGLSAVSVHEYNRYVRDSLATVNEQGVDLRVYQPFGSNTKAVSLDEPSTLMLAADMPRLDGATALYPLYAAFARAVYPEKEYDFRNSEVMCTTTADAYSNLLEGKADMIFAAAPSKQQLEAARSKGIELKLTPIGREAFVFFVNSRNTVQGLSKAQLQGIYTGDIRDWSEVGGSPGRIRAFQRPENSGSQSMLQRWMEDKPLMTPPKEDIAAGMGEIIDRTAVYRNYEQAIGYSFLFFATQMIQQGEIRLLEVDGIAPNRSTIQNGHYPLAAEFYAITTSSSNPNVAPLLQWILSPQGQSLVEKTDYTPL
ncbi:PstS family phosphate ABC transporter substrate-binding protein [Paenibacillus sp. NPDC056579]|uniref:PstS family phosphate ABC transporter substrate-binding protein n=1 Tax=Paenibacillus sp. NPDC056579 TaxID=3345871 RepID=UPI0036807B56